MLYLPRSLSKAGLCLSLAACNASSSPTKVDARSPLSGDDAATVDASPLGPGSDAAALDAAAPDDVRPQAGLDAGPGPEVDSAGAPDLGVTADLGDDGAPAPAGQFSATLNATTPYHLGSEHRGYMVFGTVVDVTPGAEGARVGAIMSLLDTDDLVKWVWPKILVKGHSYEMAVFEDHLKNRTCKGTATAEPQWLFKIPNVSGDYEFKWVQPVPHTASCQDFPPGPLP